MTTDANTKLTTSATLESGGAKEDLFEVLFLWMQGLLGLGSLYAGQRPFFGCKESSRGPHEVGLVDLLQQVCLFTGKQTLADTSLVDQSLINPERAFPHVFR